MTDFVPLILRLAGFIHEERKMNDFVIAIPDNRPPMLVPTPCNYRGCIWLYLDATPENARRAMEEHDRHWSDWSPDDALVRLAQSCDNPSKKEREQC